MNFNPDPNKQAQEITFSRKKTAHSNANTQTSWDVARFRSEL